MLNGINGSSTSQAIDSKIDSFIFHDSVILKYEKLLFTNVIYSADICRIILAMIN